MLDARGWLGRADFFAALLPALRTPASAGGNLDALFDCLVGGNVRVDLPLCVEVVGSAGVPADLVAYLARAARVLDDARNGYGIDACMTVEG